MEIGCSICGGALPNPGFLSSYPNMVCRRCDARAVNPDGLEPEHVSVADSGDNPVFINGLKCWRQYRYGGFVTMRDYNDCRGISEYCRKTGATS